MQDYEKLGAFYLGKSFDLATGARGDDLILYDAKDLTTHAMIIGMTGSGKTGLGLALLEEAAIDRIPIIALDPKGDLGNLLLTFPTLAAADFQPWVNPQDATNQGMTVEALAEKTAETWRKGLADWGQDVERIRRLRETVDLAIYTPGSSAGLPISVLQSFTAPPQALRDDIDLYRERIQATTSSVLGLMGIDADPITSREHVLIANIIQHHWNAGQNLDIGGLIRAIQQPPMARVGVLDVESFFPEKERFALAMQLNTLLAAPGFEVWMQGEPLSTSRLLYSESGKPRVSVISIAHLGDRERMFFVAMLLNDLISWMRTQAGTPSLRAILYMDEIFGYMPPIANPPSKTLLLTLLKQARAFGLGLVLATQNPVDLDYKGLSNIGTWFIGRLQTERDKSRVMEGLEGAAAGGAFDRGEMERTLASLGKRVFLMRNVNEDHPVVFTTRWVLSYLAGPLTREQIKTLMSTSRAIPAPPAPQTAVPAAPAQPTSPPATPRPLQAPPLLPAGTQQFFLPMRSAPPGDLMYQASIIGAADVTYTNTRYNVQEMRRALWLCRVADGPVPIDWSQAQQLALELDLLEREGRSGASFADLPAPAGNAKNYTEWKKLLERYIRTNEPLVLFQHEALKTTSRPNESERDFRIRLQQLWREQRDDQVETLRKKVATRVRSLEEKLQQAEQAVAREEAQAQQRQWDAVSSIGSSLLGAVFGRKSRASISRIGSSFGRSQKESADVERAQQTSEEVRMQLAEVEADVQREIEALDASFDAQTAPLDQVTIAPKAADVHVHFVGLAWVPYVRDENGVMRPVWTEPEHSR